MDNALHFVINCFAHECRCIISESSKKPCIFIDAFFTLSTLCRCSRSLAPLEQKRVGTVQVGSVLTRCSSLSLTARGTMYFEWGSFQRL